MYESRFALYCFNLFWTVFYYLFKECIKILSVKKAKDYESRLQWKLTIYLYRLKYI